MDAHHDKGEFDHLKEELRRLKRAGAPWYFESELHRRLHDTHGHRPRLSAFPLPKAYVLTFVALASLAAAGYMMLMHAGFFAPRPAGDLARLAVAVPDTARGLSPGPALVQKTASPQRSQGEEKPPAAVRSTVSIARPEALEGAASPGGDSGSRGDASKAVHALAGSDSAGAVVPVAPVPGRTDSAKPAKITVKDSLSAIHDSVAARRDTVKPSHPDMPVR